MDFNYNEEQLALQDTLRRFIAKDYGFEQRRALAKSADGFSRDHWRQFAELGILALPFPEEFGGLSVDGGNAVDSMLVMEMLGRGLVLEPYLASVILSGGLIRDCGSQEQKAALLPAIAGGELLMALAHYEAGGRYELNHVATTAKPDGNGYALNGAKAVVLSGGAAGKLIVSARTGGAANDAGGISLFLVDGNAPGVAVRNYPTQDGARAAELKLTDVRVAGDALIGAKDQALPLVERALDYAIAALCAEAVGAMAALNEVTLEYLKTRKQFGQPIGRFQALQHRMVDMLVATEQARSMATLAAVKVDSRDAAERRHAISAAKAYVGQSARSVGQAAVQLHGGMGVVDELNVSHYFKRLTMINATFGDADGSLGARNDMALAGLNHKMGFRGIAHGGMLVTLADSALGIALSMSRSPPQPMVTVNLTTDFVDSAHPGDWVEAHVDIQRVGKRMAFANCYLHVGDKRILRASGVFALMPPVKPKENFEG